MKWVIPCDHVVLRFTVSVCSVTDSIQPQQWGIAYVSHLESNIFIIIYKRSTHVFNITTLFIIINIQFLQQQHLESKKLVQCWSISTQGIMRPHQHIPNKSLTQNPFLYDFSPFFLLVDQVPVVVSGNHYCSLLSCIILKQRPNIKNKPKMAYSLELLKMVRQQ